MRNKIYLFFLPLLFVFNIDFAQSKDDMYNGYKDKPLKVKKSIKKNEIDSTSIFTIGFEYGIPNKYYSNFFDNTKGLTIGIKQYISNQISVYLNFGYKNLEGKNLLNLNFLGKNSTIKSPTLRMLSFTLGPTIKSGDFGIGFGLGLTNFSNSDSKTNST